jgi:tRNA pseudouridine38-40 synthase
MIDKTLWFVLGHENYKTMGTSRTDSKVSAQHFVFELFLNENIEFEAFFEKLKSNLPSDIRATDIEEIDAKFNIIQSSKVKEYHYYFAYGEKAHPYSAAFIKTISESLDIPLMKQGAKLFNGEHNFDKYVTQPKQDTILVRKVLKSEVVENTELTASFFPKESFVFKVSSKGFMRNQVRLMMGQLFELGKHNISLEDVRKSLSNDSDKESLTVIAAASGLHLMKVDFE